MRLLRPQPLLVISPGLYVPDPPHRYRLTPGYYGTITNRTEFRHPVAINQAGLRGPAHSAAGPRGRRVLAIGDSFTFGMGVRDEETFIARLPDELRSLGLEAEGLNGGLPGTGIPDVVGWFERHGVTLEPDLVVVAVFLGNDLADAASDREEVVLDEGLIAPKGSATGLRAWLHRHSHLFLLAKNVLSRPGTLPLRRRLGFPDPWILRNMSSEFAIYARTPSATLERAAEASEQAFERLRQLRRARGFRLAALLVPGEVQVDPERWQAALEMLWLEPGALDPQRPTRVFSEMLERVGIPWLDLTAPIAAALAGGETIYYQRDRHWTARGHALAARHLARFLWERGLLLGPGQTDQPVAAGLRVGRLDGRQRDADR
ncbi:MAG: hypothetical protein V3R89_03930 [Thermoanaerobaculia bacterium]